MPVDFHCHLDLYPDPSAAIRACSDSGAYVLSVTTTPKAWRGTKALAKSCPRVQTGLGLHPQIAHERIRELALFEGLLPEARYVGEIGLDGTPESKPHWREQSAAFEFILRASTRAGGRIMSIHSRRAVDDVLNALSANPDAGVPVLHWFSGTKKQLLRATEIGCWYSVGPAMLQGKRGTELAAALPRDRVLTETDGPFAAVRGVSLQPADVAIAIQSLANIWNTTYNDAENQIVLNLKSLVALGSPNGESALRI